MPILRLFLLVAVLIVAPVSLHGSVVPTLPLFISIGATPEYPVPGQEVVLKGYVPGGKGEYTYVWSVNGVRIAGGVDMETITISVGNAGSATTVLLEVIDQSLVTRGQATYIIRPTEVDLVWEGETYVPPLYRGRSYPNGDSFILFEAVPHLFVSGVRAPKSTLVYEWEVNGRKLPVQSGYGKSTLRIKPTAFQSATRVTVTVATRDGRVSGQTEAIVPVVSPVVVVYEKKPLLGISYERAVLGTVPFSGDEMTLRAVPFFVQDPAAVEYSWFLNRAPTSPTNAIPGDITFRKTGEGGGTFPVQVSVAKPNSLHERGSNTFHISFE